MKDFVGAGGGGVQIDAIAWDASLKAPSQYSHLPHSKLPRPDPICGETLFESFKSFILADLGCTFRLQCTHVARDIFNAKQKRE